MRKDNVLGLSYDTIIEVLRIRGDEVLLKEMRYGDWLIMEKQVGYLYRSFELGFSSFNGCKKV